jgi:hypothetical protein
VICNINLSIFCLILGLTVLRKGIENNRGKLLNNITL